MTFNDQVFLDRINQYAEKALADIDPQRTHISEQLEKLRPVMEEISAESGTPIDEIFIRYMDLASEASVKAQSEYKKKYGDTVDFDDIKI